MSKIQDWWQRFFKNYKIIITLSIGFLFGLFFAEWKIYVLVAFIFLVFGIVIDRYWMLRQKKEPEAKK
jgi:hypothetical protein